jgi:hypothetical protein
MTAKQRNLPFTNGGFLEAHLGAGQRAAVDCTFAAKAVTPPGDLIY